MNLLIIISILFAISLLINISCFKALFYIKNKTLELRNASNEVNQLNKELIQRNEELMAININNDNTICLLRIASYINGFLWTIKEHEYEKFNQAYNRLYFIGIPKEILDDIEKLTIFYDNCINNNFHVEIGEKPFTFKFTLKENINHNNGEMK